MNNIENPVIGNLKKELHQFGEGLQLLYDTVENGFWELEQKLAQTKHLRLQNQVLSSPKKLMNKK